MKPPLIRAGEGPAAAYARAHTQHAEQERTIANALINANVDTPIHTTHNYGLGDARQLRGIPTVGVKGGLGGAIPGTRPGSPT